MSNLVNQSLILWLFFWSLPAGEAQVYNVAFFVCLDCESYQLVAFINLFYLLIEVLWVKFCEDHEAIAFS